MNPRAPLIATQLGYAGLIPFVLLAGLCWWPDPHVAKASLHALLDYAAVILAFMGAVHWGVAMLQDRPCPQRMIGSVLPALLAWFALSLPPLAALALMATGFAVLLYVDVEVTRKDKLPGWYPTLRRPLTAGVLLALGVAAASV
jgi:hypothetical protein